MEKYLLALDQGTSSSRAIIFDINGRIISQQAYNFEQIYPANAWVEHNAEEIWDTQLKAAQDAIQQANIAPDSIIAMGITNQRETTVLWDKTTGKPIANAIVWQDRRTAQYCQQLAQSDISDYITKATGLPIDAYFSATKIKWLLDNSPGATEKAQSGDILFGTIDSWLLWKLTGGEVHATDPSNASRSMCYNIHRHEWDKKICTKMGIPLSIFPEVKNSADSFGESQKNLLGARIPIKAILGDQQAALFGQGCFEEVGMAKNTYGTGCFMLMNTGSKAVQSQNGLLTTIAWSLDNKVTYALEGSVFIAGAAIQWLRDEMGLIKNAAESSSIALSIPHTDGIFVVPAFAGLGAPHWDMYARGAILGLTRATGKAHIIRATLESIAYQSKDVLEAMEKDAGIELSSLRVDGGASLNEFLMQFQSNVLQVEVDRAEITETTALGIAMLAAYSAEALKIEDLSRFRKSSRKYMPHKNTETDKKQYQIWLKAVEKSKSWIE